jgi:hypothetical protein
MARSAVIEFYFVGVRRWRKKRKAQFIFDTTHNKVLLKHSRTCVFVYLHDEVPHEKKSRPVSGVDIRIVRLRNALDPPVLDVVVVAVGCGYE